MDKTFEEGILAGLADAVAYAKGDKTRASISQFTFPLDRPVKKIVRNIDSTHQKSRTKKRV